MVRVHDYLVQYNRKDARNLPLGILFLGIHEVFYRH